MRCTIWPGKHEGAPQDSEQKVAHALAAEESGERALAASMAMPHNAHIARHFGMGQS